MRKNGFTLIELLAVIVILAIIALIATPIILGIINDAREKANERSVELYASAVKNAIASYQLIGTSSPKSFSDLTIEYDGEVKCTVQELYEDGSFYLEGCKVNNGDKEYSYGAKLGSDKSCTIEKQEENKYSVGDVVTCNIGNTPDKFYVIEEQPLTATSIQMLTEKNIHTTEYRQSDNAGDILFSSSVYWGIYDGVSFTLKEPFVSLNQGKKYAYIYGDYPENNLYPIIEEYVKYLNQKLNNSEAKLLSYEQAESLGCIGSNGSCAPGINGGGNAPEWVYLTDYYTGTEDGLGLLWSIISDGQFLPPDSHFGVRPVITISTSDIK